MSEGEEFQFEAEFQCALAIATRLDREAQSIDTTTLLAHLAVIALDEYGYCDCPRCERQTFDRGSCSLCANVGWLNENGDRFTFPLSAAVPESSDAHEADLREWRENRAG